MFTQGIGVSWTVESPFCQRCGGAKPGRAVWMVGACPCRCSSYEPLWQWTESQPAQQPVDEERLRAIIREEFEKVVRNLPGSDAERLARDYLEDMDGGKGSADE